MRTLLWFKLSARGTNALHSRRRPNARDCNWRAHSCAMKYWLSIQKSQMCTHNALQKLRCTLFSYLATNSLEQFWQPSRTARKCISPARPRIWRYANIIRTTALIGQNKQLNRLCTSSRNTPMGKDQIARFRSRAQNDVCQKQSGAWPMPRDFPLDVGLIPPLSSLEEFRGS